MLIVCVWTETVFAMSHQKDSGQEPPLLSEYWAEGSEAAENLNAYLHSVTDESSPDFIPVEDRIAVFDLDGTLMCETFPFCFEYMVFSDYVQNHSEEMPEAAKTCKVDAIVRELGQQPVLAFGNSSGDLAMEIYTISNNPYKSAAYMVVADDEEREYGDAAGSEEKKQSYEEQGIGIISMKNDFKTIYGEDVVKQNEKAG